MGVTCSCPLATYFDLENGFESVVASSISHVENEQKMSTSFKNNDSVPKVLQSSGSGKLEREVSIRFRSRKTQNLRFIPGPSEFKCMSPLSRSGSSLRGSPRSPISDTNTNTHEAAIKLQKVYKSFRTRRKLADCAVLIEQSWWKLLDFAELRRSSISFFDLEKHETAISRWSRARTRAAKVGKGLSKNDKAQKLALQHWLEAIDPRHRYGHNLHFYYAKWLNSQSKEPFFYWLDIGEGKEVNLSDKCPRLKLQQQCIKYLGPMERYAYEVTVEKGKLLYKPTGELLNTINEPKGVKWIFVLSTSKTLYVAKKMKGSFQHSSFLAGGATLAAGRIVAEHGVLKAVWPHSGHYKPTPENFEDFILFLKENNLDLTDVKLDPIDDEEESVGKNGGVHFRNNSSGDDLTENSQLDTEENDLQDSTSDKINSGEKQTLNLKTPQGFTQNLSTLIIPGKDNLLRLLKGERETDETAEELTCDENIPEESILRRINSHKETKSFQLGKQLSCKWSTGAGPRIGCVRDYPTELQSQALEQVSLSPRSQHRLRFDFPSRSSTPNPNPNGNSTLSRASSR